MFLFGGSNLVVHISLPTWVSNNFEDEGFTPKHKVGNVIIIIGKYLRESVTFVVKLGPKLFLPDFALESIIA